MAGVPTVTWMRARKGFVFIRMCMNTSMLNEGHGLEEHNSFSSQGGIAYFHTSTGHHCSSQTVGMDREQRWSLDGLQMLGGKWVLARQRWGDRWTCCSNTHTQAHAARPLRTCHLEWWSTWMLLLSRVFSLSFMKSC